MALHPLPTDGNVTNVSSMFVYLDNVTGNYLGLSFLLIIFTITALSLSIWGIQKALSVASFVTLIACIFLIALGVSTVTHLVFVVIIMVIFTLWDYIKGKN